MTAPTTPAAWMDVLGQMERSLGETLDSATEPTGGEELAAEPTPLSPLGSRLAAWDTGLAASERAAETATERLAAEETALADWLVKLVEVRQRFERLAQPLPRNP